MRKRYFLLGALGGIAGLISQLPLAWVGPHFVPNGAGSDIRYSGTLWNGQVRGLDYIGTANFTFEPKKQFSTGLPVSFNSQSAAMSIFGQLSYKQLANLRFTGVLANLPTRDGRLKELAGHVDIRLSELQVDHGECSSANGLITTDFLALNEARWQWRGPVLSGPISCEGGDILFNLSGREARQEISANLRLSKNGQYAANITVQTDQAEAGVVLQLYGFEKQGPHYKLTEQGQWR